jgi:hypothetical protein
MPAYNHFLRDHNGNQSPEALVAAGAFLPLEIHVPAAVAQLLADRGLPIPPPVAGVGLIDTGATLTCVHESVLAGLALNPVSTVTSGTANGPVTQSIYPARLVFPTVGWAVDLAGVTGVNLEGQFVMTTPPQPILCLVGRNLLRDSILIWNGPGGFWTITR